MLYTSLLLVITTLFGLNIHDIMIMASLEWVSKCDRLVYSKFRFFLCYLNLIHLLDFD